jgi:hypothetical protein
MTIAPGTPGKTLGALRPCGQIEVAGRVCEAEAESGWIGEGAEVVVVRAGSFGAVVVRELGTDEGGSEECSDKNEVAVGSDGVSIHGPEFWLERVNAPLIGAVLWSAAGGWFLTHGLPLSLEYLWLPLGGAMSGAIFRYFVRGTRHLEAPYSDHRLIGYLFALCMVVASAIGVGVAFALGGGIGLVTAGLVVGTLSGGLAFLATYVV